AAGRRCGQHRHRGARRARPRRGGRHRTCDERRAQGPLQRDRAHPHREPRARPPGARVPRPPHACDRRHAAGRLHRLARDDHASALLRDCGRPPRLMLSTFMGLQTALRGILAQQQALDVTGHNIANPNTVGYTRKQAVLTETPAYSNPGAMPGQIGTGVEVSAYQRIRDEFIDTQLHAQTMRQGYYGALQDGLSQVETSLAEPSDNGISNLLQGFWSSWQDLSNAPENMGTRQALVQSAASLADGMRTLSSQLTTIQTQAGQNVTDTLNQINSTTASIAQLNDSIMKSKVVGDTPNDLLDQPAA